VPVNAEENAKLSAFERQGKEHFLSYNQQIDLNGINSRETNSNEMYAFE
jgi:hypothetical protein